MAALPTSSPPCLSDVMARFGSAYVALQDATGEASRLRQLVGGTNALPEGTDDFKAVSPAEPPIVDRLYALALKIERETSELYAELRAIGERVS